jgi:putative FmdB family regulatory protein
MPTYEYQCTSCDRRTEVEQRFTDEPLTTCTECGGALRKVYSAVGVVFKGSGFYKNDSRPKPPSKESKSTKETKETKETAATKESTTTKVESSSTTTPTTPAAAKTSSE